MVNPPQRIALKSAVWQFSRHPAVQLRTTTATSARSEGAALTGAVPTNAVPTGVALGTTSLLDASGYIVTRRRATVAAKITGKVIEVSLQEGQRVEAGHVIARLDDSNARAALAQSEAQVKQAEAVVGSSQTAYEDALPSLAACCRNNRSESSSTHIRTGTFRVP